MYDCRKQEDLLWDLRFQLPAEESAVHQPTMADQSTDLGRVKVLSVSITLPKAQKVTWAITSPNQQDPILTTSSDALAKQTSQLWGNTGYSLCVRLLS